MKISFIELGLKSIFKVLMPINYSIYFSTMQNIIVSNMKVQNELSIKNTNYC